jgi:hypothetical protein
MLKPTVEFYCLIHDLPALSSRLAMLLGSLSHVFIVGSNAGCTMFRGKVEEYWLPTPFACFPFTSPPCVTMCHRISTGLYHGFFPRGKAIGAWSWWLIFSRSEDMSSSLNVKCLLNTKRSSRKPPRGNRLEWGDTLIWGGPLFDIGLRRFWALWVRGLTHCRWRYFLL